MKDQGVHIIHRINLEIEAPDERSAKELQETAVRLLYNEILPGLEKWFSSMIPAEQFLRIDNLDLGVYLRNGESFEDDFRTAVQTAAIEKLEKIIPSNGAGAITEEPETAVTFLTPEAKTFEAFLHFLASGRRPWWQSANSEVITDEDRLLRIFHSDIQFRRTLFEFLKSNPIAITRLVKQFTSDFVIEIILRLSEYWLPDAQRMRQESLRQQLRDLSSGFQNLTLPGIKNQAEFLQIVLTFALNSDEPFAPDLLKATYDSIIERSRLPESVPPETTLIEKHPSLLIKKEPDTLKSPGTEDGEYSEHAGLILLHPFFEYLFLDQQLIQDGQFMDDNARLMAAHLLHFLATGEESPSEYNMLLEKYLCGIDRDTPIERFVRLNPTMKEECEKLLNACIGHWTALKNTSPGGLREGFLQRSGKLVLNDFRHMLIVEHKSQDVLLSYLPWGIGLIKLPWLPMPLVVDWNT